MDKALSVHRELAAVPESLRQGGEVAPLSERIDALLTTRIGWLRRQGKVLPLDARIPGLAAVAANERGDAKRVIENVFADTDLRRRMLEDGAIQEEETLRIAPPSDEVVDALQGVIVASTKEEGFDATVTIHEQPLFVEVALRSDRMNVLLFLSPHPTRIGLAGGGRIFNFVAYRGDEWYASYDLRRWEAVPQRKRDIETIDRLLALFS